MKRWQTFLVVAVALTIEGCASAGGPNSTTSASPTTQPSPSAVPVSAAATPCPPAPTPLPTLAATIEKASEAPAGAIPVKMTVVTVPSVLPRFQPDNITAKAGTVVFFLQNSPGGGFSPDHTMQLGPACTQFYPDGSIASGHVLAGTPNIHANETATFTVNDLTPGTYVFWCSVEQPGGGGNHAANGMVGTLTVTP